MARVRRWWSVGTHLGDWTGIQTSLDLLAGSGLAVPGATVQRVIGRVDVRGVKNSNTAASILYFSVIAAGNARLGSILGSTTEDWLAWVSLPLDPITAVPGQWVGTEPWWSTNEIDSAGQRVLGPGESLWLGLRSIRLDPNIGYQGRLTFRTLVLLPEGMAGPAANSEMDDPVTTPLVVGEDGHASSGLGGELERI